MEVLRYTSNAWGQSVLEGVSWDLLGIFFIASCAFILTHALYMRFFSPEK